MHRSMEYNWNQNWTPCIFEWLVYDWFWFPNAMGKKIVFSFSSYKTTDHHKQNKDLRILMIATKLNSNWIKNLKGKLKSKNFRRNIHFFNSDVRHLNRIDKMTSPKSKSVCFWRCYAKHFENWRMGEDSMIKKKKTGNSKMVKKPRKS